MQMDRVSMCNRIGNEYKTSNIEGGEYSDEYDNQSE